MNLSYSFFGRFRNYGLGVLLGLVGLVPCSTDAADMARIELAFFGLHVHGYASNGAWPSIPFGSIRLWDTRTNWRDLEPSPGKWNFRDLDAYVERAQKSNIRVMMTLGQTPTWAASDPGAESPYGPGASSPPRDPEDWERYVRTLAERYKGRIRYWEIWNEFNVKHFYSGKVETLADLECRAAKVLKQVDKENVVLSPNAQGGAYGALENYFKVGGARCADVIAYHFYAPRGKAEDMLERVQRVRALMNQYGQSSKSLWNTETGWLIATNDGDFGSHERPAWANWRRLYGDEAAALLLRAYALMMNEGLGAFYWYTWDDQAMGLAENQGRKPKTAATAYQRVVEWFVGTRPQGCSTNDGVTECVFTRDGDSLRLVWSDEKNRVYRIVPGGAAVNVSDFRGNVRTIQSGENAIPVLPMPQLVTIKRG